MLAFAAALVTARPAAAAPAGASSTQTRAGAGHRSQSPAPNVRARILPDGRAVIPADAPAAVRAVIAAGNRIHSKPYLLYHWSSLRWLWPSYDCSSSTSYLLYKAGLLSDRPLVSWQLMDWDKPGPGRYITVYATNGHAFIEVAGIAMDTAHFAHVEPAGSGPRWQPAWTIPMQIARDEQDYGRQFVLRHPAGL